MSPELIDLSEERAQRSFMTTFVVQGVGALKTQGRHAHLYANAIKQKQPFLRIDGNDDETIVIPTGLILLCMEGRASEQPPAELQQAVEAAVAAEESDDSP